MLALADGNAGTASWLICEYPKFSDDACITLFCPTEQTAFPQVFRAGQ